MTSDSRKPSQPSLVEMAATAPRPTAATGGRSAAGHRPRSGGRRARCAPADRATSPGSSGLTEFSRLAGWPAVSRIDPGAVIVDRRRRPGAEARPPRSGARSPDPLSAARPGTARSSAPVVAVDRDIFLGQVAGPDRRLAAAEADIGADARSRRASCRPRSPLRNRPGSRSPSISQAVVAEPDRQPVAVGRLAGLADRHDDAAPIGVLAGDRRLDQRRIGDRQRDASWPSAPILRRSPSPRPACARPRRRAPPAAPATSAPCSSPRLKAESRGSLAVVDARRAALLAAPVANSSSVSLVEVSLSTVTALKVLPTPAESSACSTGAAIGASVATKDSIVAMSGAIMPAPLAMPLMVTSASPSFTVTVATFG